MATLIIFFVSCQAFGACFGALMAVRGELAYARAMRDGTIDTAEHAHLRHLGQGLRWGMGLLLSSSLALIILSYMTRAGEQPALSASYWTLIMLSFLIILVSRALSRHRISYALGSALVFTAWWFLAYLTLGQLPPLSFGAAVALLVVATALFYAVLSSVRSLALRKR